MMLDSTIMVDTIPVLVQIDEGQADSIATTANESWWEYDQSGDSTLVNINVGRPDYTPSTVTTVYVDGTLTASATETWVPISGGYQLSSLSQTIYAPNGSPSYGSETGVGDLGEGDPGHEYETRFEPSAQVRTFLIACRTAAEDALLPPSAWAAVPEDCGYYMREAWLSVGAMAVSALMENPFTFVLSGLNVLKNVHKYAACKERQK